MPASRSRQRQKIWTVTGIVAVVTLALWGVWALQRTSGSERQPPDMPHPAGNETAATSTAARSSDPLKAVVGRWLRPDGGYVLEIINVRPDGRAEVAYFNPAPIRVSRAEVKADGSKAVALVELRDVNYPGCIYRLTYDPGADELRGEYFQAALEQTFEVVFLRANE